MTRDNWIVILDGEVPWVFGPFRSKRLATAHADAWNASHPDSPDKAYAAVLRRPEKLASTN